MKIENQELAESCKGDPVTYVPRHANGNASHKDAEHGIITRWNDTYLLSMELAHRKPLNPNFWSGVKNLHYGMIRMKFLLYLHHNQ